MSDYFVIEQNFTLSEYLRVALYSAYKNSMIRKIIITVSIVGLAGAILNSLLSTQNKGSFGLIGSFIFPVVFLVGFFGIAVIVLSIIIFMTQAHKINSFRYRYNHYGVEKFGNGMSFSEPWRNFSKINETKTFFFLSFGKDQIQVLQKRMFRDEDHLNDFRSFVKEKIERI